MAFLSEMRRKECITLKFKYYLKSAVSSFFRNGIMTIASFITVTCCLFLFGVFILFTTNMTSISKQIEDQCELVVRIDFNANEKKEQEIYNKISKLPNVTDAYLETKAQAFENFKEDMGEDVALLDGLQGEDFLRSSVKITLNDIRKTDETVERLQKIDGIAEIENYRDIVKSVISFTSAVRNGSIIAMAILLLIAVFIIQNTIKLSVFAREKEIHIMKFVGATDHFIRMPFVIEGIMIGLLGFIVSFVIIAFGYNAAIGAISDVVGLFEFVPLEQCITPLAVSMAVFGVLMGALGSGWSIKKHLKV